MEHDRPGRVPEHWIDEADRSARMLGLAMLAALVVIVGGAALVCAMLL